MRRSVMWLGHANLRIRYRAHLARELELAAHAVNSAYEGVAHWMWDHPDVPLERLADWTVELLLPGLRRFT